MPALRVPLVHSLINHYFAKETTPLIFTRGRARLTKAGAEGGGDNQGRKKTPKIWVLYLTTYTHKNTHCTDHSHLAESRSVHVRT